MLMSTGDGNIKADWQKVEKIMISWGYNFTIGAMCKSSFLDVPTCGFLSFHALSRTRRLDLSRVAPAYHRMRQSGTTRRDVHMRFVPTAPVLCIPNPQALELTPLHTAQHWSKTILKAFKERHPDNAKDGDNTNPATPVKVGAGPRAPKTPASAKGNGKGRKRPASDAETSPEGSGMEKTLRTSTKKMKYSEDTGEDDDEEQAVVKGETVDEDYDHAI